MKKDVIEYFLSMEDTGRFERISTGQSVVFKHECGCEVVVHIGPNHFAMCNKHYLKCFEYDNDGMRHLVNNGIVSRANV